MDDGMNISSEEPKTAISEETASERSASGPDFAVQPSYVRAVFLDSLGLKAGWGIAFYVAMFYPLQFVASRWAGSLELGANGLWSMALEEFGLLCAAVIPSIVLGRVEGRTWGAYGLPGRQAFRKLFWVGAVWGFASITLLLALMYGLRVFDVGHLAMHGTRIFKFGLFWAVMFLLVGFFEEFLLRGYSQFSLTRAIGFWPAAVFLSCMFGLIHIRNGGEEWPGLLAAAYRELVVCRGISCGVGLGRDIFLFGAGQRHNLPRASTEVIVSWAEMADGWHGWSGGERALLFGDCGGVGRVCEGLSGSEVSSSRTFNTGKTEGHRVKTKLT
jgi:membrane protease YdiL (CAAX protease family)